MRPDGTLFLGNGDHSDADCYHLHKRLVEAFTYLSGAQQTHDSGEYEEATGEVRSIAREIYLALTGEKPWECP